MKRRDLIAGGLSLLPAHVWAQGSGGQAPQRKLKIGVLTDLSSPATDVTGIGSIEATRMAVEDWTAATPGWSVEVVSADFQNKPDIGVGIARQWIDQDRVDMVTDVSNSAVALAVSNLLRDKNKAFMAVSAATTALTGEACSANTVQWVHDSWAMATASKGVVADGGRTWFFLTADYALGHDLENVAKAAIADGGGRVLGSAYHPLGASDFAPFLLEAQASGAEVIGVASAFDGVNIMKQAAEFGLNKSRTQRMVMLITTIGEVNGAGLDATQGLLLVTPFYWDQDDDARQFAARLQKRIRNRVVTQHHAGSYASTLHYLKAAAQLGSAADGREVVAQMKAMPTDDPLYKRGTIRVDGRKVHPMHIYRVKAPSEQKAPYDDLTYVRSIPAEEAFRPLAAGGCPLAKRA